MLLVLCGLLDAIVSIMYLLTRDADGSLTFRTGFSLLGTIVFLGMLTLAAGACTIAAGIWSFGKGRSWLLVLNGIACSVLGVTYIYFVRFGVSFRTIAILIVAMAISIGIYAFATARTLRRHLTAEWLLGAAGVASFGFACAFLAFVFRWIKLEPGSAVQTLRWMGSYFAFSAICMWGLALRLRSLDLTSPPILAVLPSGS